MTKDTAHDITEQSYDGRICGPALPLGGGLQVRNGFLELKNEEVLERRALVTGGTESTSEGTG